MGSFSKLSVWPVGYFRAYSSWILNARRELPARIDTLSAEIHRIGIIRVAYKSEVIDGTAIMTEEKIGVSVTSGSSLERLVQAYIANGGNPLDISSFMYPDSTSFDEDLKSNQQYPHGGVLAPMSSNPNEPLQSTDDTGYGSYRGGWIRSDKFYPGRQQGRVSQGGFDADSIVRAMHQIRAWANQTIKERLLEIEARIIKLSDLREQLVLERDEILVQAFGGVLAGVGPFDENRFDPALRVQNLIEDISKIIYESGPDGIAVAPRHRPDAYLPFTFPDLPSDLASSLGG
jgi:hypothetical protein